MILAKHLMGADLLISPLLGIHDAPVAMSAAEE